jgi:hypothetical protein
MRKKQKPKDAAQNGPVASSPPVNTGLTPDFPLPEAVPGKAGSIPTTV